MSSAINDLPHLNTMADKAFLIVKCNLCDDIIVDDVKMIERKFASVERLGERGV